MIEGKVQPQAKELEGAVIGAVMIEKSAIYEVADILNPDCFYVPANQKIWAAIERLNSQMKAIDLLTVMEELTVAGQLEEVGGMVYVVGLTHLVGSSAHIREHAMIVYDKHILRQLALSSFQIADKAFDNSISGVDLLSAAQSHLDQIGARLGAGESFYDTVINRATDLSKAQENFTKPGLMTYLWKFDNHTGGFQAGELIIVAGRPGMGKSACMCDFAYYQAKNGIPVGIFSLEMVKAQLVDRFNSIESEVEYQKMRTGGLTNNEISRINKNAISLAEMPIQLNDEGGIGIGKLSAIAKMWKHKFSIKALYVDYMQLISAYDSGRKFGNREQELSYISSRLKTLAKNLGIPVIALSQLSRAVESRGDKRPMLSDLRETGAIEQDADMVLFPFRPSYYGLNDAGGQKFSDEYAEIIIAKFRSGKPDDLIVEFLPQFSKFRRESTPMPSGRLIPMNEAREVEDSTPF